MDRNRLIVKEFDLHGEYTRVLVFGIMTNILFIIGELLVETDIHWGYMVMGCALGSYVSESLSFFRLWACNKLYHIENPKNKKRIRNQRIHSKRRFEERYGEQITDEQIEELIQDVENDLTQPIAKVSNAVFVFKSGDWFFVYDKRRKNIMTFLTESMIDYYLEKERKREKENVGENKKVDESFQDEIYQELMQKFS